MKDIFAPNQRLIILQVMAGDADYALNNGILQRVLAEFGHGVSLEKTDQEINWLAAQGLVTVEDMGMGLRVAKLTRRGLDLVKGYEVVQGVERPGPESL